MYVYMVLYVQSTDIYSTNFVIFDVSILLLLVIVIITYLTWTVIHSLLRLKMDLAMQLSL